MTLKTWAFSKKKNSTAQPSGTSRDYTVYMKENSSIENPVFILGTGINAGVSYCQAFGNYYFVDDIVLISADQVELHCSIDVLATHKTAIGNLTTHIDRCAAAAAYNNMIYDAAISQSQLVISESVESTAVVPAADQSTNGTYIIGVIGGYGSTSGGISVYALSKSELEEALDFMFTESNFTDVLTDSIVKSFFNPFQYIVFLRWYPFTKAALGTLTYKKIKFGWWETASTYGQLDDIRVNFGAKLTVPTPYYSDFRNYDQRFTQLFVELPTVGGIFLDPSILSPTGVDLFLGLTMDICTGETIIYLETVTGSGMTTRSRIGTYKGSMGASIPVGQVNGEMGSLLSSAAQVGLGIATGDAAIGVEGLRGVIGSYNPPPSMLGTYGSRAYFSGMVNAKVTQRVYASGDLLTNVYGRPCHKNLQISTLSGFVKCQAASIALDAPDTEIEAVNNYLNTGFYYE